MGTVSGVEFDRNRSNQKNYQSEKKTTVFVSKHPPNFIVILYRLVTFVNKSTSPEAVFTAAYFFLFHSSYPPSKGLSTPTFQSICLGTAISKYNVANLKENGKICSWCWLTSNAEKKSYAYSRITAKKKNLATYPWLTFVKSGEHTMNNMYQNYHTFSKTSIIN